MFNSEEVWTPLIVVITNSNTTIKPQQKWALQVVVPPSARVKRSQSEDGYYKGRVARVVSDTGWIFTFILWLMQLQQQANEIIFFFSTDPLEKKILMRVKIVQKKIYGCVLCWEEHTWASVWEHSTAEPAVRIWVTEKNVMAFQHRYL